MSEKTEDLVTRLRREAFIESRGATQRRHKLSELLSESADRLAALTTPQDGDARERLLEVIAASTYQAYMHDRLADAILAAFPVLSRAAAPEPEWEYQWGDPGESFEGFDSYATEELARAEMELDSEYPSHSVMRRRKAGPWEPLPVGSETDGE